MKKIVILFLLFVSLILTKHVQAEDASFRQSVRGIVVDAVTAYPLPGAHIILLNVTPLLATTSDEHGEFILHNAPLGRHSIEVRYVGYKSRIINNLNITSGKQISIEIQLEETSTGLAEISVFATKQKEKAINDMTYVSARTFSVEETERYAGSLGDPARMVANFAGVMTQNDSRNDIIIRGNSPIGVQWRIEGIEIPNPNHFGAQGTTGGPVSMVNNNLLSNSDFLTGAFPAEYGNATSGVFDLNLRSGNTHKTEFVGQVGFNGFELGAEGPAFRMKNGQKSSYLANFRYSTMEVMDKLGFNAGTGTAVPQYKDFTFLKDIPGTKAGRFKVFGLWGESMINLGRKLEDSTANKYNLRGTATDFGSKLAAVGSSHTYFFNPKTRIKTSVSWQQFSSLTVFDSARNNQFIPVFRGNQTEQKIAFNSQLRRKVNADASFVLGINFDRLRLDLQDSVKSREHGKFITQTDTKGSLILLRSYGQWQQKLGKNLTANAGLHLLFVGKNKEIIPEPRLGFIWQTGERSSVNAGFGMHSQLQPREIYFLKTYLPASNSYILTNENVKTTRSNHFVLGHQWLVNSNARIKTEAYFQQLYRVPVSASFPEFSMLNAGDFFAIPKVDSLINTGKGRNHGVELTIERFLNKGWYLLFTASLFESKYTGYDQTWRNTAFNGNYVFNFLGGYEFKIGKNSTFTLDLKTVLAGGKRFVPVDFDASAIKGEEVRNWAKSFENRYNDYFRTDLRLGIKVNHKRLSQEWAIDLQNITGYQSIFMESYDQQKNELYQIYQQGFMPMFLYRVQF